MSGGSYGYSDYHIRDLADSIRLARGYDHVELTREEKIKEGYWNPEEQHFKYKERPADFQTARQVFADLLEKVAIGVKAFDYFDAGDYDAVDLKRELIKIHPMFEKILDKKD